MAMTNQARLSAAIAKYDEACKNPNPGNLSTYYQEYLRWCWKCRERDREKVG